MNIEPPGFSLRAGTDRATGRAGYRVRFQIISTNEQTERRGGRKPAQNQMQFVGTALGYSLLAPELNNAGR